MLTKSSPNSQFPVFYLLILLSNRTLAKHTNITDYQSNLKIQFKSFMIWYRFLTAQFYQQVHLSLAPLAPTFQEEIPPAFH